MAFGTSPSGLRAASRVARAADARAEDERHSLFKRKTSLKLWAVLSSFEVRGVLAPATTATQPARRLPAPTASAKGPSDSCRVVGETLRAPDAGARDMAAAVLTSAQQPQGATTPEASRRVQRALLKLELPDWFRQHYRPPRRDAGSRLGDDGAPRWPKWRAPPAKDALRPAQTATTTLPADRRNLVIPKRVTFREKGSSRSPVRNWAYRSLRTPYLGWRSAELGAAAPTPHQAAAVR
ncbi:uncharacterized protein LOC144115732 [Amblyomma americanum]